MAVFVFLLRRVGHQFGDEVERLVVRHADDRFDAHRVEEEGLPAVLRVDPHQRMHPRRRQRLEALLVQRLQFARAVFAEIDMHRLQGVDAALRRLGKLVVGEVHVDVLRVAAVARQRHGIEDRRLGRGRVIGMVGVEGLARDVALARHGLLVRDEIHLRKAGDVQLLLVVRLQLPPHLHRGEEILRPVFLVAHDKHMVLREGAVDRRPGFGIDRLGQVEAADFGSGVRGEGRDRVRHGGHLHRRGRARIYGFSTGASNRPASMPGSCGFPAGGKRII